MMTRQICACFELGADAERLLGRVMHQQGLTGRAYDRILKVARAIADLPGCESLSVAHLAEAIQGPHAGPKRLAGEGATLVPGMEHVDPSQVDRRFK